MEAAIHRRRRARVAWRRSMAEAGRACLGGRSGDPATVVSGKVSTSLDTRPPVWIRAEHGSARVRKPWPGRGACRWRPIVRDRIHPPLADGRSPVASTDEVREDVTVDQPREYHATRDGQGRRLSNWRWETCGQSCADNTVVSRWISSNSLMALHRVLHRVDHSYAGAIRMLDPAASPDSTCPPGHRYHGRRRDRSRLRRPIPTTG